MIVFTHQKQEGESTMMMKPDVLRIVGEEAGVSQSVAKDVIDAFCELIEDELVVGNEFRVGNVGKFKPVSCPPRVCMNPNTHKKFTIGEKVRIRFSANDALLRKANETL
ncbi:MAG: HU family DNA-binding protein [Prevotella sp.]|nr:HU family DNA-binding protein [Massilibacteroides sp.]